MSAPRLSRRYTTGPTQDGLWAVIDVFTGQTVDYEGRVMSDLGRTTAAEYCVILNEIDRRRRAARDHD